MSIIQIVKRILFTKRVRTMGQVACLTTIAALLQGCAPAVPVLVYAALKPAPRPQYKAYEGRVLPRDKVAILLADPPANVVKVDGKWYNLIEGKHQLRSGVGTFELLPGLHTIEVRYYRLVKSGLFSGSSTYKTSGRKGETLVFDAQAGHTYRVMIHETESPGSSGWTAEIVDRTGEKDP